MLFGIPPFYNQNYEKMYELIKNSELKFPRRISISDEAKDLLEKLLVKDPAKRLGQKGLDEIKEHPFFSGLDFDLVETKKVKPPFVPEISKDKYKYFDSLFLAEPLIESYIDPKARAIIMENQHKFKDFK